MRLLILILLIANFLTFAWFQWGQPVPIPAPKEVNPEKIHIVSDEPPVLTKLPAKPITEKPSQPDAPAPAIAITKPPIQSDSAVAPTLCATWGPIPAQRVEDAQIRLNKLQLGERLNMVDTPTLSGPYWVYLAPLKSKTEADNKVTELQNSGIKDIAVVRDGKWQNAISMGLYGKEAIANDRLAKLKKLGISAQIEARGKTARSFALTQLSSEELEQIKQIQTEFGGPAIKKSVCE